jgi:hypothetical protein
MFLGLRRPYWLAKLAEKSMQFNQLTHKLAVSLGRCIKSLTRMYAQAHGDLQLANYPVRKHSFNVRMI